MKPLVTEFCCVTIIAAVGCGVPSQPTATTPAASPEEEQPPGRICLGRDVLDLTRMLLLYRSGGIEPYHEGAVLQVDCWLDQNSNEEHELVLEFRNVGSNPFLAISLDSARIVVTNGLEAPAGPVRCMTEGVRNKSDQHFRLRPLHDPTRIIDNTRLALPEREDVKVALDRLSSNGGIEIGRVAFPRVPTSSPAEIADWEHVLIEVLDVRVQFFVGAALDVFPVNLYLSSMNVPSDVLDKERAGECQKVDAYESTFIWPASRLPVKEQRIPPIPGTARPVNKNVAADVLPV